jgi:hypothetical protein
MAVGSNETRIFRRFLQYGIPHIDQYINTLYHAIVCDALDVIKILTEEHEYRWYTLERCIELAKRHENADIIEYLESL